jgi:flagellar FliL protein
MAKAALAEVPPPDTEATVPAKRGKGKLIVILLVVLLLAGGGGFAAWKFMAPKDGEHAVEKPVAEAPPVFVPVDQFTVNLNAEGGEQFLQAAFTLKVTDQEVVDAVKLRLPDLRNQVLLLLSSKKASELNNVEGKQLLATEILAIANEVIAPSFPVAKKAPEAKKEANKEGKDAKKEGKEAKAAEPVHAVTGVLFTHFIIQ